MHPMELPEHFAWERYATVPGVRFLRCRDRTVASVTPTAWPGRFCAEVDLHKPRSVHAIAPSEAVAARWLVLWANRDATRLLAECSGPAHSLN